MSIKIGLEVHLQLDTKTKLFCGCPTKAKEPNTAVCPVCLGHPGSKPVLNKQAVSFGGKLALALRSAINPKMFFSRKTYFYPDLSKNFQITQYELPLASGGLITLDSGKQIRITRLHIEEDPASLLHSGTFSLVDYNRSGVPLAELVTGPDMTSPDEAREFLKKLQGVLVYLDVFDENEGVVKADANVSVEESGYERVELKNITGFKEIEAALLYEVRRQREAVKQGDKVVRETRGWNAEKGISYPMRSKEEEEDYGYIAEPDLPVVSIDGEWLEGLKNAIPELPEEKAARWVKSLKVDEIDAKIIAADPDVAKLYEYVAKLVSPVLAAKWTRREVLRVLNLNRKELADTPITADCFGELLQLVEKKAITDRVGQELMERMINDTFSPREVIEKEGLGAVSDEGALKELCRKVIEDNPKAVEDFGRGEQKAFEFLVGKVMAATKGKGVPAVIRQQLELLL